MPPFKVAEADPFVPPEQDTLVAEAETEKATGPESVAAAEAVQPPVAVTVTV